MIKAVKDSIPVLKEHGLEIAELFYDLLFEARPEWKKMFNSGKQRDGSGAQAQKLAYAVVAYAEHIENPSLLLSFVQQVGYRHVSRGVKADDYPVVGQCLLDAVSRVTGLPMEHEIIQSWACAYGILSDLFIAEEEKISEGMQAQAGSWTGYREFSIVKKVNENYRCCSLCLVPTDGEPLADFKPGQFVSLLHPELMEPRYYSISSTPGGDNYCITVQKEALVFEKSVSAQLVDASKEGDLLYLSQPTGSFSLASDLVKPSVLIASGIGITPILPMIAESLEKNIATTVFHCVRNQEELLFRDHLLWLGDQGVNVNLFFSQSLPQLSDSKIDSLGRLTDIQRLLPDMDCYFYICGSDGFIKSMVTDLTCVGVVSENIKTESFDMGSRNRPDD